MGTPIEEIEYGNDCLLGWEAGNTPKFVYVMFDGVKLGFPVGSKQVPNGVLFKCEQKVGVPCQWFYNEVGPGWMVDVKITADPFRSHISMTYVVGMSHFTGWVPGAFAEHDIFLNTYHDPWRFRGVDGVATIFWMESALELIDAFLLPASGTFLEFFLKDESVPAYKFCNIRLGMNFVLLLS